MEETVKQRLMYFIEYKGITVSRFEKNCGLSNGYMKSLRSNPGLEKLSDILRSYPDLSRVWLLTGEGEMLKTPQPSAPSHSSDSTSTHSILYFPKVDGSMGDVTFCDTPDESEYLPMVIPGYEDCTHAVNVWGDSMSPLIESGQIIVMKLWEESFFDWGNIYFIVTKGGYRTTKRVYPSDREGFVQLRSENAAKHPPFEIERSDIARCFLVKGWICRSVI